MLSRTADSLYWLSRYMERAENTARAIDAASRLSSVPNRAEEPSNEWEAAISATGNATAFFQRYEEATRENVIEFVAFSPSNPSSIISCFDVARSNARAVRTALTVEMWEVINSAWLDMKRFRNAARTRNDVSKLVGFVTEASLRYEGCAYRTMLRNDAYYFARLGTYIERADATARLLDVKYHVLLPEREPVGGSLDYFQWSSLLRSVSALTAYHWVYKESLKPWHVADLLILRPELHRSLISCYMELVEKLDDLARQYGRQRDVQRLARRNLNRLQHADIGTIFQSGLHEFLNEFLIENNRLANAISESYLR